LVKRESLLQSIFVFFSGGSTASADDSAGKVSQLRVALRLHWLGNCNVSRHQIAELALSLCRQFPGTAPAVWWQYHRLRQTSCHALPSAKPHRPWWLRRNLREHIVLEPDEAIGQARKSNGGARTDEVIDELAVPGSPLLTSATSLHHGV